MPGATTLIGIGAAFALVLALITPARQPANDTPKKPVKVVAAAGPGMFMDSSPDMFMDGSPDMFMDRPKGTV